MIKDVIAQVRAKVNPEELEKIESLLSQVIREESAILSDLSAANHESKTRKEKIRELQDQIESKEDIKSEYERKLKDKEDEIEQLKGIEGEYNEFKNRQNKNLEKEWNNIYEKLNVKETDPKYEHYQKVLNKMIIEDEMTADIIQKNLEVYNYAKEFGGLNIKPQKGDETKHPGEVIEDNSEDPLAVFGQ